MTIEQLGWSSAWEDRLKACDPDGLTPGRVVSVHRTECELLTERGVERAALSGRLRMELDGQDALAVGDWAGLRRAAPGGQPVIAAVLPRRGALRRQAAGQRTAAQVVAANVDVALLVSGLDHDFNLRRIERYVAFAYAGGAAPVIVLNKADLCHDAQARLQDVEAVAPGTPALLVCGASGAGVEALRELLPAGVTGVMLGSSGVGKSTLINRLLDSSRLRTGATREQDSRGRHTTTRRELLLLPGGGLIIDTPGMRELQLWADGAGALGSTFADIEQFARSCRFRDCRHDREPGCGVRTAIEEGRLASERLASFHKLQREERRQETRQDQLAQASDKARLRRMHKAAREHMRRKRRF